MSGTFTPGLWTLWTDGPRDVTVNPLNGERDPPGSLSDRFASISRGLRDAPSLRTPGDPDDDGYMCGPGMQGTAVDPLFLSAGSGTDGTFLSIPRDIKQATTSGLVNPAVPPPPDQTGGP
jgi:hypothetical protein